MFTISNSASSIRLHPPADLRFSKRELSRLSVTRSPSMVIGESPLSPLSGSVGSGSVGSGSVPVPESVTLLEQLASVIPKKAMMVADPAVLRKSYLV